LGCVQEIAGFGAGGGARVLEDVVPGAGQPLDPRVGIDFTPAGKNGVVEAKIAAAPEDQLLVAREREARLATSSSAGRLGWPASIGMSRTKRWTPIRFAQLSYG
jgi:hypothetical protein